MKLLFDENVSPRLVDRLAPEYPGSLHVRHAGLRGAEDHQVWQYARGHGFAIVSKDYGLSGAELRREGSAEDHLAGRGVPGSSPG